MRFREYNNLYSTDKVRKGIIRGENLSDELNCATIILSHINKIPIESYDLVELTNESDNLEYWFVANYNRKTVSFNPLKYDYVIDLMSVTKLLETIILPNMTITNIGQNRNIFLYIDNAMKLYFNSKYGTYGYSNRIIGLFSSAICPECTFSEPTLREYLDYLLGFKNCIAKLDFTNGKFVLDYMDLNPDGEPIDTTYISYMEQSQCAEQYITQLEHTFNDVISQYSVIEYHRLKGESYLFNTESAKLILNHKPYDINRIILKNISFEIYAYMNFSGDENIIDHATIYINSEHDEGSESGGLYRYINGYDIDITDYLVVDNIFQSLETLSKGSFDTLSDKLVNNNYMNNSLRWSRGSNVIDNFHYYQTKTTIWSSSDEPAITYAIRCAIYKKLDDILAMASYVNSNGVKIIYSRCNNHATDGIIYNYLWSDHWQDVVFEVEYVPYLNSKLKIPQDNYRHLISAPDNTMNTFTNISSFIKKSIEKNRQLGNDSLMFYARSLVEKDGYEPVYKLGQYYVDEENNKYILNYLETETKNNCVLYKGILSKNYSNRNIHTIINREKRYYSLADNNESVVRNEVKVKKYTISLSNYYYPSILMLVLPFNILKFSATLNDSSTIKGYVSSDTIAEKNIVSHSSLFYDNIVYATKVGSQKNGGYEMQYLKYTDSYGELISIDTDFKCSTGKDLDIILNCEFQGYEKEAFIGSSMTKFELLKDNREQLCLTVVNIFKNDSNDYNIFVNEDRIANLLNGKLIYIETSESSFIMKTEKRINFGKPFHEIVGFDINYPTYLKIYDSSHELCLRVSNYNGEYLKLEEMV
ncbi:MAG: hypothetical protein ACI35S_05260 [Anaeroplasma sp.]